MRRLVWIHLALLLVALFIAFGLVPFDRLVFKNFSSIEVVEYYTDAFSLKNKEAWKIVFTWFLGLTCGRLMLRALLRK